MEREERFSIKKNEIMVRADEVSENVKNGQNRRHSLKLNVESVRSCDKKFYSLSNYSLSNDNNFGFYEGCSK